MRITGDADAGELRVANLHDFRDLSHLAFEWTLEEEGEPVAEGALEVAPRRGGRDRRGSPCPRCPRRRARRG